MIMSENDMASGSDYVSVPEGKEKTVIPEFTIKRARALLQSYEKSENFNRWRERCKKIRKIYEARNNSIEAESESRLNILYSNVQTLSPATFSRLPKPQITRRNMNKNQKVQNAAASLLQDAVEYFVKESGLYDAVSAANLDRLLSGRGAVWALFKADDVMGYKIHYQYVDSRDFGHTPTARTWDEVREVWRVTRVSYEDMVRAYGKTPSDEMREERENESFEPELEDDFFPVVEFWHKPTRKIYHFCKEGKSDFLKVRDDTVNLPDFFPCPRPLYGVLKERSLCPVPDFNFYEALANDAEKISYRIGRIAHMVRVRGVFDKSFPELKELLDADDGEMIGINDFLRFSQKNGFGGSMEILDVTPQAAALTQLSQVLQQYISQINEITGISDILRGTGVAHATATAEGIKAKYATLRLAERQDQMQDFIRGIVKITAHLTAEHYEVSDLVDMTGNDEIAPDNAPPDDMRPRMIEVAPFLKNERLIDFQVSIETNATVRVNEEAEQTSASNFLSNFIPFLDKISASPPQTVPLAGEMLRFLIQRYPVGKGLEDELDSFITKAKQMAQNPPPPPPAPEVQRAEIMAKAEIEKTNLQGAQKMSLEKEKTDRALAVEAVQGVARLHDTGRSPYGGS